MSRENIEFLFGVLLPGVWMLSVAYLLIDSSFTAGQHETEIRRLQEVIAQLQAECDTPADDLPEEPPVDCRELSRIAERDAFVARLQTAFEEIFGGPTSAAPARPPAPCDIPFT